MLLNIKNLTVAIEGKEIIKGLNLQVNKGEVHAIMGPNGTGKSTLAAAITGREGYEVTEGEIWYKDQNIIEMDADERANLGIFLSFQYPVEIPGVSMTNFMRTAINAQREYRGLPPMPAGEFLKLMEEKKKLVDIHSKLTNRSVNEGFSGGEKKKNEIFQMALLEPTLAILDETDSGLDIDALRTVAKGVNELRSEENAFVVITHYQRLLEYIVPDFVHVMYDGKIVKSGSKNLALELEDKGYEWLKEHSLA
ncbi:MAG: Fe-S cluster assembly ATPase SufC [Bacteroidales bacterium]|jgi:Fe-S cluster assembly ATP-binding protein|nr:Fe-S cluster assembly ATPase SufC [Bacteroidales bacterium]MDD4087889.1 Fe-S cluster assembly ATPase SufC [Bacteroidales bacterium]MDY0086026.1 Fe-S cluster assembly ATPase SufC [Bacteroidales bacterium]